MNGTVRRAAAVLLLVGAAARPAVAQQPAGLLPRELTDGNAVIEAGRTLTAEIDGLAAAPPTTERDARVALRRIAFDLLFHGAAAGADSQAMAIAGLRLHAARAALDGAIARAAAGPDGAREALARFADGAAHGLEPLPAPATPETTLARQLAPLEMAVAVVERGGAMALPGTAWPPPRAAGSPPPPRPGDGSPSVAEDLATIAGFRDDCVPDACRPAAAHALARAQAAAAACRDPAAGTVLADVPERARTELATAAADLRRLSAVAGWIDLVAASRPGSRGAFASRCQRWAAALRDPVRAAPAREAMDAMAREARLVAPGEFERRLRAGDPQSIERCAGRSADLLAAIDRGRDAWAAAWSVDGNSGTEGARLLRSLCVATALDVSGRHAAMPADVARLDRWGGFAADPASARPHPRALAGRAALALDAALAGRDADADAELERIDVDLPVLAFLADAARELGSWTATRDGMGDALAAVRDRPADGAYLGSRRAELMLLSRTLVEESWARAHGLPEAAAVLRSQAAEAARALAAGDPAVARLHALRTARTQPSAHHGSPSVGGAGGR